MAADQVPRCAMWFHLLGLFNWTWLTILFILALVHIGEDFPWMSDATFIAFLVCLPAVFCVHVGASLVAFCLFRKSSDRNKLVWYAFQWGAPYLLTKAIPYYRSQRGKPQAVAPLAAE